MIVLLVRVGGLSARQYDEKFPGEFGQIGDEGLGLGGIANTWRTLPVLSSIANVIKTHAPAARVINMLAPLGTTTRLLIERGLNTVGICELPTTTEEAFGGDADKFDYGGLNHLGWFTPRTDAAAQILANTDAVDRETVKRFGATTLFYYYRVFDPSAASRMSCAFQSGRAGQLQDLTDEVLRDFEQHPSERSQALAARATPWFDRALVPIMSALLGGAEFDGFVNARNGSADRRLVPHLSDDAIVEVRAKWHANGFTPTSSSQHSPECVKFLQAVSAADDLAYRGAIERDMSLVHQAVTALPLAIERKHHGAILQAICNQTIAEAA